MKVSGVSLDVVIIDDDDNSNNKKRALPKEKRDLQNDPRMLSYITNTLRPNPESVAEQHSPRDGEIDVVSGMSKWGEYDHEKRKATGKSQRSLYSIVTNDK